MKKIKFYIKRLLSMNYKAFFDTINIASKETKKIRLIILIDLIYCSIKYGAGHLDYRNFKMYTLKKNERNKILTVGRNASLIRTLNDKNFSDIFENKALFLEKFSKYINRSWLKIDQSNYDDFEKFIKDKKEIIVKPLDGMCGKGIEKIKIDYSNRKNLFQELLSKKQVLLEEVAHQCKEMSALHPSSINTIRVYTIVNEYNVFNVVGTYVRIGNNNSVVDNFNSGGVACPVDIMTGKITHQAVNKQGEYFTHHPITNIEFIGYTIPRWNEVLKYIENVSRVIPEVRYIGWDICIGEDKIFLIEGNSYPGQDLYQIPKENIGTYNIMLDALNKKK